MNDQEYIRAAVDLADDWSSDVLDQTIGMSIGNSLICDLWNEDTWPQWVLDALAAQLVRQVDVVLDDWRCLELFPGHTAVRKFAALSENGRDLAACYGKDRTMNTIKAIVDSKVLSDD